MRYPVSSSKEDFQKNWYIAQYHGDKTDYGYHDGWDINLKTGGDTDLGKPLYACLDFTRKYYHYASHLESGFGVHTLLEVALNGKTYWLHYAHMQPNPPEKDSGKEGDVIGYIGKTGRPRQIMPAHLHFAVFKKLPPKLDMIATTKALLDEYWIDPNDFFNQVQTTPGGTMQMYKGYDLDNKDSMKVAVDKLVEIIDGKYVEKSKLDEVQKQLTECQNKPSNPQNGSTEQFEINGKTETFVENGKTVTINYAVKR